MMYFQGKKSLDVLKNLVAPRSYEGALVVARGHICGMLEIHVRFYEPSFSALEEEVPPNLWHKQLSNMNEKGLATLVKKGRYHTHE